MEPRVSIGVVGPFSGPRACYGELLKTCIQRSPLNQFAKLLWEDDEASAIKGKEAALRLVQHKPLAVIGHFNSDSALEASRIYEAHQLPLLLPASTSMQVQTPLSYRLCPNDLQQVRAIITFLLQKQRYDISLWSDGSAYGERLKVLFNQQASTLKSKSRSEATAILFFGAHYRVAEYMLENQAKLKGKTLICCDDCDIDEFKSWMKGAPDLYIAMPKPGFAECISIGIHCLLTYLKTKTDLTLSEWLSVHSTFIKNQNADAQFVITPLREPQYV